MSEGLIPLLTSIAELKLTADADIGFLNDLESQISTKVREAQAAELAGQASAIAPTPPAGGGADMLGNIVPGMAPGPNSMGAMGPMPAPPGGMGPMGGGMPPAPPNADELRRTLSL
jgi:hypothetical protein